MFSIDNHNILSGFQKLAYIAHEIGFCRDEIAGIAGVSLSVAEEILDNGFIPYTVSNGEELFDKFYALRILFSDLLRLSGYNSEAAAHLLTYDTEEFNQCIEQPPWYLAGYTLREFIIKDDIDAVHKSILWLNTY